MAYVTPDDCLATKSPVPTEDLISMLKRDGFMVRSAKGDHFLFHHPDYPSIRGSLVYNQRHSASQEAAAEAILEYRKRKTEADVAARSVVVATPVSAFSDADLPKQVELLVAENGTRYLRHRKATPIGIALRPDETPQAILQKAKEIEREASEFQVMLGRSRTQYDYHYETLKDGTIQLKNTVYRTLDFDFKPFHPSNPETNPFDTFGEKWLDIDWRDSIVADAFLYISQFPTVHMKTGKKGKRDEVTREFTVIDPVFQTGIKLTHTGSAQNRAPMSVPAEVMMQLSEVLMDKLDPKTLFRFSLNKVTDEGDHLRIHNLITEQTITIPKLRDFPMPPALKNAGFVNNLPPIEAQILFASVIKILDRYAQAAENLIDAAKKLNEYNKKTEELTKKVFEFVDRFGLSQTLIPAIIKPGEPCKLVISGMGINFTMAGYGIKVNDDTNGFVANVPSLENCLYGLETYFGPLMRVGAPRVKDLRGGTSSFTIASCPNASALPSIDTVPKGTNPSLLPGLGGNISPPPPILDWNKNKPK